MARIAEEHQPLLDLLDRSYKYLQLSVVIDTNSTNTHSLLVPYPVRIVSRSKGHELVDLYCAIERRYLQQGFKLVKVVNRFVGDCQVIQYNLEKGFK